MIDPVALDRLEIALRNETKAHFDVPIPPDDRWEYYRELAYRGFTPSSMGRLLGWNTQRIQQDLRARNERQSDAARPRLARYANARRVVVEHRPGAIVLNLEGEPHIVEGDPDELLAIGRLVYGAAAAQHEEKTA